MTREEYAWKTFERKLTQLRSQATYEDVDEHAVLDVLLTFVKDLGNRHTLEVIVEELGAEINSTNPLCDVCERDKTTHHYCDDCMEPS